MMNKTFQKLALFAFIITLLSSCEDKHRLFEENTIIEKNEWKRDQSVSFEFDVIDTSLVCDILANIRSTKAYPYYNLFLKVELINPEGIIIFNDIREGYLFNPTTGKPFGQKDSFLGISLGDLYDQRILLNKDYKFTVPGKYKLRLSHYMRDNDPVVDIMAVGFRVQKVQ